MKDVDRHKVDMDEEEFVNSAILKCTSSFGNLWTKKTVEGRKGMIHPPLLDIGLEDIVIDELHLLLRVMDKLLTGLILTAQKEDDKQGYTKKIGPRVSAISSTIKDKLHIPFKVYYKKNADGSASAHLDWTSLEGKPKKNY